MRPVGHGSAFPGGRGTAGVPELPLGMRRLPVLVRIPKLVRGVAEHMQEVAATPLGAPVAEEEPANGGLPPLHGAELAADLASRVPASVEHHQGTGGLLLAGVLDVDVSPQVWLQVAAHLELYDGASPAQLGQGVPEEGVEVVPQLPLVRLQLGVRVVVVPPLLLQAEVAVEAAHQQGAAAHRPRVAAGTPFSEAARPRLDEEGAGLPFHCRRIVGRCRGIVPRRIALRQLG